MPEKGDKDCLDCLGTGVMQTGRFDDIEVVDCECVVIRKIERDADNRIHDPDNPRFDSK